MQTIYNQIEKFILSSNFNKFIDKLQEERKIEYSEWEFLSNLNYKDALVVEEKQNSKEFYFENTEDSINLNENKLIKDLTNLKIKNSLFKKRINLVIEGRLLNYINNKVHSENTREITLSREMFTDFINNNISGDKK